MLVAAAAAPAPAMHADIRLHCQKPKRQPSLPNPRGRTLHSNSLYQALAAHLQHPPIARLVQRRPTPTRLPGKPPMRAMRAEAVVMAEVKVWQSATEEVLDEEDPSDSNSLHLWPQTMPVLLKPTCPAVAVKATVVPNLATLKATGVNNSL